MLFQDYEAPSRQPVGNIESLRMLAIRMHFNSSQLWMGSKKVLRIGEHYSRFGEMVLPVVCTLAAPIWRRIPLINQIIQNHAPNARSITPAIPAVSAFIFSSDSASTITRASASVPE